MFLLVCPSVIGFFIISTYSHAPGNLIGTVGCEFTSFLMSFHTVYFQFRTFFTAFFKYICIVHNEQLSIMSMRVTQFVNFLASRNNARFTEVTCFNAYSFFKENCKIAHSVEHRHTSHHHNMPILPKRHHERIDLLQMYR